LFIPWIIIFFNLPFEIHCLYTGCHKYVAFAGFAKERHYGVWRFEIIIKDDNRYPDAFGRCRQTACLQCSAGNQSCLEKNEEKLLERLDQAKLDGIDNPDKTQQTAAIGTLFWQTL
jgi:hypothetical protein